MSKELEQEFITLWSSEKYSEAFDLFNRGLNYHFYHINNLHPSNNLYPLILAIQHQRYDIAITLIQKGVDVNFQRNDNLQTPIFYAIEKNVQDLYYILIDAGAKIDVENTDRNTLLMTAINFKSPRIALDLIARGIDIHIQNPKTDDTALFYAVKNGLIPVILELAKKGADIDIQHNDGLTAFLWSIQNNKTHIADKLLPYVKDINLYIKEGAALHLAIKQTMYNLTYKIMDGTFEAGKLDINLLDSNRDSVLMLAIKHKMPDIAARLIKEGSNIHLTNAKQESALTFAVENNDMATFSLLLERGAEVNNIYNLKLAVSQSNPDILLSLIEYGALRSSHFSEISNKALTNALSKTEWNEMQRVLLAHGAVPPHTGEFEHYHQFDRQTAAIMQLQELRNLAFQKYNTGDIILASRALATKCSGHSLVDKAISHGKHMKFLGYLDLWLEKGQKVGFTSCDQFNKYHNVVYRDVHFINFTKTCKNVLDSKQQTSEFNVLNFDILSEILCHLPTSKEQEYGKIYHIHQDLNYDIQLLGCDA